MKGGGLTWAGWLMIGVGGLLIYAGMTGQSLVGELAAVLNGKKLAGAPAAGSGAPPASAVPAAPARTPQHPPTIPNPTYGPLP